MSEAKIETITIRIPKLKNPVELTIEEARKLHEALDELFRKATYSYHYYPYQKLEYPNWLSPVWHTTVSNGIHVEFIPS